MNRREVLVFELDKKTILSSNTYKSLHWAVKGKITDSLRSAAVNEGMERHHKDVIPEVEKRLEALQAVSDQAIRKSRRTKALQKDASLSAKAIKALVEEEFSEEELPDPNSYEIPRLFNKFRIKISVAPPTRRRLDPVNLYPTVKALIDGLTDVGWWEDDDFSHLLEISFVYGGLSGHKDTFKLSMEVEEVSESELSSYTLSA